MNKPNAHDVDLDWFFGIGMTRFVRSPFGAMLDSQQSKYVNPKEGQEKGGTHRKHGGNSDRDTAGRWVSPNIEAPENAYSLPPTHDDYTGLSLEDDKSYFPTSWSYMLVKSEQRRPAPEPELRDLHRFGRVSSALYKLEKQNPILVSVLMAYSGENGTRWSRERGEGRLLAIYPLTSTGSKWVASLRDRALAEISEKPEGKLRVRAQEGYNATRDDERLALECFLQDKAPTDIRRQRLKKIEDEARRLYHEAMAAYAEVAA